MLMLIAREQQRNTGRIEKLLAGLGASWASLS
jgi:hypothetical protein